MPVIADNIPSSLLPLCRWVCWRWVWDPRKHGGTGGFDKPLFDPRSGHYASSTDPSTWTHFATCLAACRRGEYDGAGITLGPIEETGLTLVGLDLDDALDLSPYAQRGDLAPWAHWALRQLDSYAERSPSGTGAKALAWGEALPGRRQSADGHVEIYAAGRYFTVTGHRLAGMPAEVMPRAARLQTLHALLLGPEPKHVAPKLSDRDLALSALAGLSSRRAVGYDDWLAVGMALHAVDSSGAMLAEWDRWSRQAPDQYAEGVCARKWQSFAAGGGLTLGSLIYWAREDGWIPPVDGAPKKAATPSAADALAAARQLGWSLLDSIRSDPTLYRAWRQAMTGEDEDPCA
jgi:hypothetical protein